MTRPTKSSPSLWPKEHGAYAEMAFPLLTGMALGRPTLIAALLVVACVGGFLVHEPVLVLLGIRGRRTREARGSAARRHLAIWGSVALMAGAGAVALGDAATRRVMVAPVVLVLVLVPFLATRREKTALGEAVVAAAFSATLIPVGIASGVPLTTTMTAALSWLVVFLLGTFMVRLTLERARKEKGPMRVVSPLAAAAALIGAALGMRALGWAPLAIVPTAVAGLVLWMRPVSAKQLRVVGWSLVGGNVFAFVAIVATLRG